MSSNADLITGFLVSHETIAENDRLRARLAAIDDEEVEMDDDELPAVAGATLTAEELEQMDVEMAEELDELVEAREAEESALGDFSLALHRILDGKAARTTRRGKEYALIPRANGSIEVIELAKRI